MSDKKTDGGPAFPELAGLYGEANECSSGAMYTDFTAYSSGGMTLRDYFAAKAMQGDTYDGDPERIAVRAYKVADAMLAVRGRG